MGHVLVAVSLPSWPRNFGGRGAGQTRANRRIGKAAWNVELGSTNPVCNGRICSHVRFDFPSSMAKITVEEARELAKKARQWTFTAEGKKQIEEAADRAQKTIDELEQAQQLDPQKLSEPFTV